MGDCIRAMGFRGIIAPYNNGYGIQTTLTRRNQQVVAMNTYHDPNDNMTGPIFQTSSFDGAVAYVRNAAATRLAAKPFVMTEYDHVFWNRHRYEAGLAMPAYAALQDWDILCRHSNGALVLGYGGSDFNEQYIRPYRTALDPVARAGETLSALLFRRGDVAKALHRVVAQIQDIGNLARLDMQEPDAVTIMSLMSRFAQGDAPFAPDAVTVGSLARLAPVRTPSHSCAAMEFWLRQIQAMQHRGYMSAIPERSGLIVRPNRCGLSRSIRKHLHSHPSPSRYNSGSSGSVRLPVRACCLFLRSMARR